MEEKDALIVQCAITIQSIQLQNQSMYTHTNNAQKRPCEVGWCLGFTRLPSGNTSPGLQYFYVGSVAVAMHICIRQCRCNSCRQLSLLRHRSMLIDECHMCELNQTSHLSQRWVIHVRIMMPVILS